MLTAEIIAIGSELLTPNRTDTNSLWLTEQLNAIGIDVKLKTIVGDDEARLEETLRDAIKRSDVIISTGGLGPTEDDITRKVYARVLNRPLVLNEAALAKIRRLFESRGYRMAPNNERQAFMPREAEIIDNQRGSAPGFLAREKDAVIFVLPGPPKEMMPMFENSALPILREASGGARIRKRVLKATGLGESMLDEMIAPVYTQYQNPTTTILFSLGEIEIHLTAMADSDEIGDALNNEVAEKIIEQAGKYIFAQNGETMEEVIAAKLTANGFTVATAESCTGGLLAKRLTDISGSSNYFIGGIVAYSNETKINLLGVPAALIEQQGAVSAEVAEAMAQGIKTRTGATFGIGITGIAGPTGGTEDKPVGLVFIGYADDARLEHRRIMLPGDRERIRHYTSQIALEMIRLRIADYGLRVV